MSVRGQMKTGWRGWKEGGRFKSMLSTRMQLNSYLKPAPWLD